MTKAFENMHEKVLLAAERSFEQWIRRPETKLLLSMLPGSTQPPELVQTLLRSAFDFGVQSAEGTAAMELALMVLHSRDDK